MKRILLLLSYCLIGVTLAAAQGEDAEGCKDHPMFNRMPHFHLSECDLKEFDAYSFTVENSTEESAKRTTVEGKFYHYTYLLDEGASEVSDLQIFRNFENALKSIHATIVGKVVESGNSYSFICAKIANGTNETWIKVEASAPEYQLTIVEKEAMVQVIRATDILAALNADGYIALDILFDNGKSTIKPESQPIIAELERLLSENPALKVSIEGHTDNVGDAAKNKQLSEQRANAVASALTGKGIGKQRLSTAGWGAEKPVADNRTAEGRAKNRRVEIVKR
ncbi:OmpA family protein [uncultured Acetobacteroides sp.]|uniref:OmpA family protein n=1 Tax=uncultured Acetobacteroides sp. TaxID=1760811 RepID=UPI0029F4684C|nr:OmpA family protein [uncultured Acetobacteroides sp.]